MPSKEVSQALPIGFREKKKNLKKTCSSFPMIQNLVINI